MHITDLLATAEFVCNANGKAVWEVANMRDAAKAVEQLGATAYNWCPIQQPHGPAGRKPRVAIAF